VGSLLTRLRTTRSSRGRRTSDAAWVHPCQQDPVLLRGRRAYTRGCSTLPPAPTPGDGSERLCVQQVRGGGLCCSAAPCSTGWLWADSRQQQPAPRLRRSCQTRALRASPPPSPVAAGSAAQAQAFPFCKNCLSTSNQERNFKCKQALHALPHLHCFSLPEFFSTVPQCSSVQKQKKKKHQNKTNDRLFLNTFSRVPPPSAHSSLLAQVNK